MRKIIRDQRIVDDNRLYLKADDAVPADGEVVVPLATFLKDAESLLARRGGLGVRIAAGEGIADIVPFLDRIDLVCLEFPTFYDGRSLSAARELRERHRYAGEIRAVGEVLRDQIHGMHRCGINAFDVREGKSLEDALLAFRDFSTAYQGDVHDPRPVYRRA